MTKTFGATTSSRPLSNARMPSSSLLYRSPELFSIEATNFILEGLRVACHHSNSLSITFKDISRVPTTPQLLSILASSLCIPSPTRTREKRLYSIASRRSLSKGVPIQHEVDRSRLYHRDHLFIVAPETSKVRGVGSGLESMVTNGE